MLLLQELASSCVPIAAVSNTHPHRCCTLPAPQATQDFDYYDLDDVDRAFGSIIKLKHTQAAALDCPAAAALAAHLGCGSISVTPFPAGHTVGGCVWRVEVAGEEVVYALDTNHRKER